MGGMVEAGVARPVGCRRAAPHRCHQIQIGGAAFEGKSRFSARRADGSQQPTHQRGVLFGKKGRRFVQQLKPCLTTQLAKPAQRLGLQQVTSLIDHRGRGISQGIGTGSHDLNRHIVGITMLQGIAALAADPETRVIVLISKPPEPEVAQKVLKLAVASGKEVVVDFIGADPATIQRPGLYAARTLEETAYVACQLAEGQPPAPPQDMLPPGLEEQALRTASQLAPRQRYIRGLFSGGTLCAESLLLLQDLIGPVYSNTPLQPQYRLPDVWWSREHTAIDMGDDIFTRGRPHPMIDFRLRNERILQEAADPETAVILLDIVLGYGSHPDPAGELLPAIHQAGQTARQAGREIIFVGSVCGTRGDPQNLERQETLLRESGVLLAESNAQATRLAAMIVKHAGGKL